MNTIDKSPTPDTYHQLQSAYDWFNTTLFNQSLPNCLITLQRKSNAMGYFSAERWVNSRGEKTDEIALNPAYFANHSLKELLQTLVHEMCHQWQQHFGQPSRSGYHNKQWANKMESLGLMPSSTGEPGGFKTGQHMGDYSITGEIFEIQAQRLVEQEFNLPWVDRFIAHSPSSQDRIDHQQEVEENAASQALELRIVDLMPDLDVISVNDQKRVRHKHKLKTTYLCQGCKSKVWGKPNLALACLNCNLTFKNI